MGSCFSVADRSEKKERKEGGSETEVWKLSSRMSLLRILLRFRNSSAGQNID